jgi:hypothetical protein
MKSYRVLLYEDMHQARLQLLADKAELIFAHSLDETDLFHQVKHRRADHPGQRCCDCPPDGCGSEVDRVV